MNKEKGKAVDGQPSELTIKDLPINNLPTILQLNDEQLRAFLNINDAVARPNVPGYVNPMANFGVAGNGGDVVTGNSGNTTALGVGDMYQQFVAGNLGFGSGSGGVADQS